MSVSKIEINQNPCTHHWVIEIYHSRYSKGICTKCRNSKLFDNIIDYDLSIGKRSKVGIEL